LRESQQQQPKASSQYPDLVRPPPQASLVQLLYRVPASNSHHSTTAAVHPIGWTHGHHPASRATTLQPPFHPQVSESCRATIATNGDIGRLPSNVPHRPRQAGWASHALLVRTFVDGVPRNTENFRPPLSRPSHSTLGPKSSGMTTFAHQASRRPSIQPRPDRRTLNNSSGLPPPNRS